MTALFEARGLSKDYAVRVLDSVSLTLEPGTVHGLIGANGAGKSTLCQLISGTLQPSAGSMTLEGAPYAPLDKRAAEQAGVRIVRQKLSLIPTLTVAENLFLNRLPQRFGFVDRARLTTAAREALARVGLEALDPATLVGTLGTGTRQLVEIAAALHGRCRVLILDEPTAALTAVETERLFQQVRAVCATGVSCLYVSHRLEEIRTLCKAITVLRDGRCVAQQPVAGCSAEAMVTLMAGRTQQIRTFTSHRTDEPLLRVDALHAGPRVRDISFTLHRGERLGVAGLVGAGRSECLRALFGADAATGRLWRCGAWRPPFRSPREAARAGIGLVTEDRLHDGLLPAAPVRTNTTLGAPPATYGWLDGAAERERAERRVQELDTRLHTIEQPVQSLSGGNQQKVVLAKWLELQPEVLLLDEPTMGIDIPARRRIEGLLEELSAAGRGLVIVSSELGELMDLCDSIIAYWEGGIVGRFHRGAQGAWPQEALREAAFGGVAREAS